MTKNFDALLESMLSKLISEAPVSMEDSPEEMTASVHKKIQELPGKSQHWGPLQKLSAGDRERIIRAIINNVFTERGNTYSPMADDRGQLKELIKSAITKVANATPEFKAGGKWAVQFLADRLANEDLLGKVKYTTEGGQEIKKDVTQKEMKAALNKALGDTKGQNVWRKSAQEEEPEDEEQPTPAEIPKEEEGEPKKVTETVYTKTADLNSDDADLQKAFNKLPDNTDMSWDQVIKKIGTSKALALLDAGGLTEEEKEKEVGEEEDVPDLELGDDAGADISSFDKAAKMLNPHYSDTRGSFERFHGDY